MNLKLIFALIVTGFLSACTHSLHLANVSEFSPTFAPQEKGTRIQSEASQTVFMGFTQDTSYVDKAYAGLGSQCSNGKVQGIYSEYITDHGFLSWTNRVRMQALCVR